MDCASNHSIFLRANGSLACWCDAGNGLILQPFDRNIDYGREVYLGQVFQTIREKLRRNEMPFPEACTRCHCLANHVSYNDAFYEQRRIATLQVEPTVRCTLECPSCFSQVQRKSMISPPFDLDLAVLEKILRDLKRHRIKIDTVDFQGHGEPLLHREVWRMIRLSKRLFPTAKVSLCTNAQGHYQPSYASSGVDRVTFSIDGVDQQSYEPYRRHGDFSQAFQFMKDFACHVRQQRRSITTIWKYVLFAHNDTPEQLRRAQVLAQEAGVTDLKFVITQLGPKSSRIVEAAQIPLINNSVKVSVLNYLADLESIRQGIDEARRWCDKKERAKAEQCLQYSAAMISRRLRFNNANESVPAAYQEAIHELMDVHERFKKDGHGPIPELSTGPFFG